MAHCTLKYNYNEYDSSSVRIFKTETSWLIWFVPVDEENHPSIIDSIMRERSRLTGKD